MKQLDEIVVILLYLLFGAVLGLLVFVFGVCGVLDMLMEPPESAWFFLVSLAVCGGLGAALGWLSYRYRHREFGSRGTIAQDAPGGMLLGGRLMAIGIGLVGLYFLWRLARSLR